MTSGHSAGVGVPHTRLGKRESEYTGERGRGGVLPDQLQLLELLVALKKRLPQKQLTENTAGWNTTRNGPQNNNIELLHAEIHTHTHTHIGEANRTLSLSHRSLTHTTTYQQQCRSALLLTTAQADDTTVLSHD